MIPVLAAPALAVPPQTLQVDAYGSYPYVTVTAAVAAANDGDTIEIHGPGLFGDALDLQDRTLHFVGVDGAGLWTLDADKGYAWVHGTSVVTMTGFDIDGLDSGRAFRVSDAAFLEVSDSTIHDTRSATGSGGAFLVEGTAHLDLRVVDLSISSVDSLIALGGFVRVETGASLLAVGSTFSAGDAAGGGGALSCAGACTIEDCVFDGNNAGGGGGAIVADTALWVYGSRFCGNSAGLGGAISTSGVGGYVQYSVFGLNVATLGGGAIYTFGDLTSLHNDFLANEGGAGGAAFHVGSALTAHDDLFVDHLHGSAVIDATYGTADLAYDLFFNNVISDVDGGGSGVNAVHADPMFTSWDGIDCAAAVLTLEPGSYALDAGDPADFADPDGTVADIGAFGPVGVCVPTMEYAGDSTDSDCDGTELCYQDADYDGFGDAGTETTVPFPCTFPYYVTDDDICPYYDDRDDADGDSIPDGCDPTPPGGDADVDVDSDADVDADVDTDTDADGGTGDGGGGQHGVGSLGLSLSGGVCGCAGSGGAAVPWAGLAVLAAVVLRRRP